MPLFTERLLETPDLSSHLKSCRKALSEETHSLQQPAAGRRGEARLPRNLPASHRKVRSPEQARSPLPNPSSASTSRNWLRTKPIALKMSKNKAENHLNGSGQRPRWHSSVGSGPRRTSSTHVLRVPQQGVHALWYVSELFLMDRQTRAPTAKDKLTTLCW